MTRIGLKFKDRRKDAHAPHPFVFTDEKGHYVVTQTLDIYDEDTLIYEIEMMGNASIILEICDKLNRKIITYEDKESPFYNEELINLPEEIYNEHTEKLRKMVIEEKKMTESKFKLGDMFTKKHTRDTIPLEIYEINYNPIEPVYKLKPIRLCGDDVILGEEALTELYNKIN